MTDTELNLSPNVDLSWVTQGVPGSNRRATVSSTEDTVPRVSRRFSTAEGGLSYTMPQGAGGDFERLDPLWSTRNTIPVPSTPNDGLLARVVAAATVGFAALAAAL